MSGPSVNRDDTRHAEESIRGCRHRHALQPRLHGIPVHGVPNADSFRALEYVKEITAAEQWEGVQGIYFVSPEVHGKPVAGTIASYLTLPDPGGWAELGHRPETAIWLEASDAPCVAVNAANNSHIQTFGLLHELAHHLGIGDEEEADIFALSRLQDYFGGVVVFSERSLLD